MDIIFISGKENRTVNFHIKFGFLILIMIMIITVLVVFVNNITNFATIEVDRNKLIQLRAENKIVREELVSIEKEITNLNVLIDSLELYDKKLRTYASLAPINEDLRSMGVGGYTPTYDEKNVSSKISKNLDNLSQTLNNLLARAKLQKQSFDELLTQIEEKKYLQDHTPSIIPVQGWLIRGFDYQVDPFTNEIKMHEGLDIAAPLGTPIVAPADGTIKFAGHKEGFGLTLQIDHGYGFITLYAHCQRLKVTNGMTVKRGDIIAYVGNTGKSTGPHLHYEVRLSQTPINPMNYIITASDLTD